MSKNKDLLIVSSVEPKYFISENIKILKVVKFVLAFLKDEMYVANKIPIQDKDFEHLAFMHIGTKLTKDNFTSFIYNHFGIVKVATIFCEYSNDIMNDVEAHIVSMIPAKTMQVSTDSTFKLWNSVNNILCSLSYKDFMKLLDKLAIQLEDQILLEKE